MQSAYCREDMNIYISKIIRLANANEDIKNISELKAEKIEKEFAAHLNQGIDARFLLEFSDRGDLLALRLLEENNIPETELKNYIAKLSSFSSDAAKNTKLVLDSNFACILNKEITTVDHLELEKTHKPKLSFIDQEKVKAILVEAGRTNIEVLGKEYIFAIEDRYQIKTKLAAINKEGLVFEILDIKDQNDKHYYSDIALAYKKERKSNYFSNMLEGASSTLMSSSISTGIMTYGISTGAALIAGMASGLRKSTSKKTTFDLYPSKSLDLEIIKHKKGKYFATNHSNSSSDHLSYLNDTWRLR